MKKNLLDLLPESEMVRRTKAFDWASTPVGAIETWSHSLSNTVGLILQSGMPMYLAWGDHFTQFYNDAYRPILGSGNRHPEALGASTTETWAEIWDTIGPMWKRVKDTGVNYASDDFRLNLLRNGYPEESFFTYSYSAVRDDDGSIQGLLVTCAEITKKVHAERKLQQEKRDFYNFLMQSPIGTAVLEGPDFIFSLVNPLYLKFLFPGRTAEDFLGKSVMEVIPEVKEQGFIDILENVYRTGAAYISKRPISLNQVDGPLKEMHVNFTYQPKYDEHGKINGIIAVIFEVTDEVVERNELEKIVSKFNLVVENLGEGLIIFEPNGTIQTFNPEALRMHGYHSMLDVRHEDELEDLFLLFDLEGHQIPMNMWPHNRILRGEKLLGLELELRRSGQHFIFSYNGMPIYDENKKISLAVLTIRDVTAQRNATKLINAEKQKIEEALKSRDEFISIASHELKTPLTSMKLQSQIQKRLMLKNDPKAFDPTRIAYFSETTDVQINRLNRLVDDMLDISRMRSGVLSINPDVVNLGELIVGVIDDMRTHFSTNNFPRLMMDEAVVGTWDALRIEQVIVNLLTNAIRYGEDRPVMIEASKSKGMATIKVIDSGIGISSENHAKIFERFERINSKELSGLGLGLFLTKQIVIAHSGNIRVESELGKGSTFIVELPINQVFPPGNPSLPD